MIWLAFLLGIVSLLVPWVHLAETPGNHYAVVEQLNEVPSGWSKGDTPSPFRLMRFKLAIHQEDAHNFEQQVIDISTPGHASYGRHLKREDVDNLLRPADQSAEKVLAWLESEEIPSSSVNIQGNWVTFTATISQAESLMRTRFYQFHNPQTGESTVRTLEYSVPQELYPYVQLIQPTTRFAGLSSQDSITVVAATDKDLDADCSTTLTPDCLRELYGIDDSDVKPDPRNMLGVSGYLDQYARYSDFHAFMKRFAPNRTEANFTVVSINNGLNPQDSPRMSTEASMDIQYAYSLAYNALGVFYSTGGRGPFVPELGYPTEYSSNEPYLEQLHYLVDLPDDELPAVLSTSYGEDEQSVPERYAKAVCSLFAQLGARGVSVIFSSGDSGVGDVCMTNDGANTTRFKPIFPASCPFVTSVGGTYEMQPEKAIIFSGGGFSEYFPRPSYQDASVGSYLDKIGDTFDGMFNAKGRGIPDVSAQAMNYIVLDHGTYLKTGGTSASTPVFAAIISRLNAARLEQNKPRLGFLNPWLYSLGQRGFTDIVEGGSTGCSDPGPLVAGAGWNATTGWDPVTGIGTPLYSALQEIVESI